MEGIGVIALQERGIRKISMRTMLSVSLALVALFSLAFGLQRIVRGLDPGLALDAAIFGLLIGWALAKSPLPGWLACAVAEILGAEAILVYVGHLGGKLYSLGQASTELLAEWIRREPLNVLPALQVLADLSAALVALGTRLFDWLGYVVAGVAAFDPVAAAVVWGLVIWTIAGWAGWAICRRGKPFEAMLPANATLVVMLAYVGGERMAIVVALGATLLLMAVVGYATTLSRWRRAGIDIALDIDRDTAITVIPVVLLFTYAAWLAPSISARDVARIFQELLREHAAEANRLPDSLGLVVQPRQDSVFEVARSPGMPRRHLIGAGQELSRQIVMNVRTQGQDSHDSSQPPQSYWRSATYDRYTGRGWFSSGTEVKEYQAGEPTTTELAASDRLVWLDVEMQTSSGGLLYTTGELVTADQNYRVAWRSPEDAFGGNIGATKYRVESRLPAVSQTQLRASGTNYADWVRQRYLSLPDDVPARVLVLARDLTATEPTPYDRALAIESFLRKFPYSLDLPAPPPNRDVVDYFLFELQRGYCDYYASSMVVLARAAGLPARLVLGYAPGSYDEESERFTVTEADAHSWVEIYFPGYGWIEFEPTAVRAPINRPVDLAPSPRQANVNKWTAYDGQVALVRWLAAIPIVLAGVGALFGVWYVLDLRRLGMLAPWLTIGEIYRRLGAHAKLLGSPVRSVDTPNEFAAAMRRHLRQAAQEGRGEADSHAETEMEALVRLYVRARYSPHVPDAAAREQTLVIWKRLRGRLWRVHLKRFYRRAICGIIADKGLLSCFRRSRTS